MIQIDASRFTEFEISELEISRFYCYCTCLLLGDIEKSRPLLGDILMREIWLMLGGPLALMLGGAGGWPYEGTLWKPRWGGIGEHWPALSLRSEVNMATLKGLQN